jgi:hypothetical protein
MSQQYFVKILGAIEPGTGRRPLYSNDVSLAQTFESEESAQLFCRAIANEYVQPGTDNDVTHKVIYTLWFNKWVLLKTY